MSSLQLPEDIKILKFLQQPRIRYEIKNHLKNYYASTLNRLNRLEKLGYIFVVRTEPWRGKLMKYYLITSKGRAILRGYEEAERRKE